jgi:hypothetical protein
MVNKIREIFDNILKSFKNEEGGYSSRKLSAAIVMLCVVVAHVSWLKRCFMTDDFSLLENVLIIDYSFITSMLGLTTWSSMQKNKIKQENDAAA